MPVGDELDRSGHYERNLRPPQRRQEILGTAFAKEDSQNRRAVDDHTPPLPYPRIRSRSLLVTWRPRSFRGMLGQISLSRKSSAWANRGFPDGPRAIRSLRSSRARRMAAVLVSPVICASSSPNHSTLSFLIFIAMVEILYQSTMEASLMSVEECLGCHRLMYGRLRSHIGRRGEARQGALRATARPLRARGRRECSGSGCWRGRRR
jgi:hypothetical protein